MAKEELKQKADNFVNGFDFTDKDNIENNYLKSGGDIARQSYIAGAIENCIQWHDLRKDPNDLPKDRHNVIVALTNGYSEQDNYYGFRWGCNSNRDVIAWCEIPHFEE